MMRLSLTIVGGVAESVVEFDNECKPRPVLFDLNTSGLPNFIELYKCMGHSDKLIRNPTN